MTPGFEDWASVVVELLAAELLAAAATIVEEAEGVAVVDDDGTTELEDVSVDVVSVVDSADPSLVSP